MAAATHVCSPNRPEEGQQQMTRSFRLLYIMNIPSPYRWHLFSNLYKIGAVRGVEFHVAFLAPGSRGRRWNLNDFPQTFQFSNPWGVNLSRHADRLLNPGLIAKLLFQPWDWIILGGYDNPTTALLTLLPLLRTRTKLIRNEGNLQAYSRFAEGPVADAKRMFLRKCDGYLVPGNRGREWLDYWLPERENKPVHIFPNVIDDSRLVAEVQNRKKCKTAIRQELGISDDKRLFLTPARLSPEKGLCEFVEKLPADFGQRNAWIVAGEGPLQSDIERMLDDRQLREAVSLIGYVHQDLMPQLYAAADVFLLPSFSDSNPLSAIEAAFSGLPLLISTRLGNYPELLTEGVTGWGFDPSDPVMTQKTIANAIEAPTSLLQEMSERVYERAHECFQSDLVCSKLLDFLFSIHPDLA